MTLLIFGNGKRHRDPPLKKEARVKPRQAVAQIIFYSENIKTKNALT